MHNKYCRIETKDDKSLLVCSVYRFIDNQYVKIC